MIIKTIATTCVCLFLIGCASTPAPEGAYDGPATLMPIRKIPDHGRVMVQGQVDQILTKDEFIFRDKSGSAEVITNPEPSPEVYYAEHLTVIGAVNYSGFDKFIGERKDIYAEEIILPSGKIETFKGLKH